MRTPGRFGILWIVNAFIMLPLFAAATGPSSGGGGGAYVCFEDDNKTVKSAFMFDLDEGAFYEHNTVDPQLENRPWKDVFIEVVNRIRTVDPEFSLELRNAATTVLNQIEHNQDSMSDKFFPPPQDLGHGRVPPLRPDMVNCRPFSAAVFQDDTGTESQFRASFQLYISTPVWEKLSELHKAVLALHESLYLVYRDVQKDSLRFVDTDSAATRKLVGLSFSTKMKLYSSWSPSKDFNQESAQQKNTSDGVRMYFDPFLTNIVKDYVNPLYVKYDCQNLIIRTADFSMNKNKCQLKVITQYHRRSENNFSEEVKVLKAKKTSADGSSEFSYDLPISGEKAQSLVLSCKDDIPPSLDLYCKNQPSQRVAQVSRIHNQNFVGITIYKKESVFRFTSPFAGEQWETMRQP